MKNQAYRMAMLFDFYGDVLTDRQGVRDVIVRAEAILTDLEDKTGLIKRFHTMKQQLEQVQKDAQRLTELSQRYDDPELEALSRRILDTTEQLLKE